MAHLLKIEWLKIKNYKAFWVFAVLYLVSIFLVNYIAWSIQVRTTEAMPGSEQIIGNVYSFPKVWQTVGWMSSWLLYFPGMIIIMLMVNEFNFKTHRQNVIDGLSRQQFIGVKMVLAVILALLITIINFITAFIFGSITSGSFSTEGMENLAYVFLQSLSYIFFALLLAVLFRRSGLAIIIFILYGIIFEWLISALAVFELKTGAAGYFLPLQLSDVLVPMPFADGIFYRDAPSATVLIVGIAVYLILYVFFARKKFITDDL